MALDVCDLVEKMNPEMDTICAAKATNSPSAMDISRTGKVTSGSIALMAAMLLFWISDAWAQEMYQHPAAGSVDPYAGYKMMLPSGRQVDCCASQHCHPAQYDITTHMLTLKSGEVINIDTYVNADGSSPTIYWSSGLGGKEGEMAHVCEGTMTGATYQPRRYVFCMFLPGEGA